MSLATMADGWRQDLLKIWYQRAETDELDSKVSLEREGRIDVLSPILEAVVQRIRQPGQPIDEISWDAAVRHGRLRRQQDHRALAILREELAAMALRRFLEFDPSHALPDMAEMNAAIDEGMAVL
ncbi:MAG: hypothetical protein ACRD0Y_09890, partial [Terriglobales bacterium]